MEQKSPLKMPGSYVGAIIGGVLAAISISSLGVVCEFTPCEPQQYLLAFLPIPLCIYIGWKLNEKVFS